MLCGEATIDIIYPMRIGISRKMKPWWIVFVVALGTVGLIGLLVVVPSSDFAAVSFTNLPEYRLWVYFVSIISGLMALFIPWVLSTVRQIVQIHLGTTLWSGLAQTRRTITTASLFMAYLSWWSFLARSKRPPLLLSQVGPSARLL